VISRVFQAGSTIIICYGIWTKMMTKNGLSIVSSYSLIVPVSGLIFARLFFDEIPENIEIPGSVLVLLGLAFMSGLFRRILTRSRQVKS
jgi:O-acetylserine/cysteine efflux transporter